MFVFNNWQQFVVFCTKQIKFIEDYTQRAHDISLNIK